VCATSHYAVSEVSCWRSWVSVTVTWRQTLRARGLRKFAVVHRRIAAGPVVAALAGMGIGGAVGGVAGALVGMGIPEYEAKRYEGRLQKGGILLSAHCDTSDEIKRVKEIMKCTGAEDISSTGGDSVVPKGRNTRAANQ
jgi:hypothetical protein